VQAALQICILVITAVTVVILHLAQLHLQVAVEVLLTHLVLVLQVVQAAEHQLMPHLVEQVIPHQHLHHKETMVVLIQAVMVVLVAVVLEQLAEALALLLVVLVEQELQTQFQVHL